MKTILVSGASGFIGSHTLNWLSKKSDIQLIAACRDKARLPADFNGEVRQGDFRDPAYLAHLLDGVDVVVNAMAWSSLWRHRHESEALFLKPTLALIDRFVNSSASRLINISTTSAASPGKSRDAMSKGIPRRFWPHLCNLIRVENHLREIASNDKCVVNLRLGIFAGEHYALGVLPILLPRLKTHLVPWVAGGKTHLPIADGRDYAQAMGLAALDEELSDFNAFNVVGKEVPRVREVIMFLHQEFGYPKPHFSVSFFAAYIFAALMEKIDPFVPWEPLIVRSIVHLLEETGADNDLVAAALGYQPEYDWRDSIRLQVAEMQLRQQRPMRMAMPVS